MKTIDDNEIALIKSMIIRGMKNHDIQFFFNRPDRAVNSGRISGIRSGTYSNSRDIPAASHESLEAFLAGFRATKITASVTVPGIQPPRESHPLSQRTLCEMFIRSETGAWKFKHGESDCHECKENFGFKHADKWLRAIAALANNQGGYVLFGVKDKALANGIAADDSYKVVGLANSEFFDADPAAFAKKIKSTFDPTPRVEISEISLGRLQVGIIYVYRHLSPPVIATKGEGNDVREGDIYFRYPGQSARIKYSDLRSILDERDRATREQILPMVAKLLTLGPRDAMVADLAHGVLSDEKRSIFIGRDLLEQIKFIREGEFHETEGEPTLQLIGNVQAVDARGAIIRKGFVTPADLIQEFLDMSAPYDPKEYIKCAIEGGNGAWLPIYYYARKAGLSDIELADFIMNTAAPLKRREMYRDRALGKISAFHCAGGQAADLLSKIVSNLKFEVKDATDAANFGRALAALNSKPDTHLDEILAMLKICIKIIQRSDKQTWMSAVRRGVARLDELYFRGTPYKLEQLLAQG